MHIREQWTPASTLLGLISSVYRDLRHWRSNQWPQIAVLKLCNWAISSHRTQVTPNQLVMVIARPNNLNVSCKLHPYSFQRTRSPSPGPRLPKKLRNMHPRNYYDLRGLLVMVIQFTNPVYVYDFEVISLLIALILNESQHICLHTVKWFQELFFIACTQLNSFKSCCQTSIIRGNISDLFAHC